MQVVTSPRPAGGLRHLAATLGPRVATSIGLPDGTGLDFINHVRQFSNVPAVALTGFGMEADMKECLDAGFNLHLVKPVTIDQLREVIASLDTVPPQNIARSDRTASSRD